jgi:hypothetical protein
VWTSACSRDDSAHFLALVAPLLVFVPVFLLGGGGLPPSAMGSAMRRLADVIPLAHVTRAIQQPWLGLGHGGADLAIVTAIAVACVAGWWKTVRL